MKFTDSEKLIVLMLRDLYENLDIKGEIDPGFISSAILNDHLWGIKWKYGGIPFEGTETPKIVNEVVEILDMWSFIEESYQSLSNEDKLRLEEEAHPFGKDPKFYGFDGNSETEYMSIAMFLVNDLDRFERFKGNNFNSHFPSVDSHQKMSLVFEPIRSRLTFGCPMSLDDLITILNAPAHPSNKNKGQPQNK